MKTLALELGHYAITANCVAPGEIATPMTGQEDQDPHARHRPGVPLGRPGDAREIAAVIAFLASAQASYVTGASCPPMAECCRWDRRPDRISPPTSGGPRFGLLYRAR